ncbi:unnamed protein product [Rhizophagus irregularis]|uniref:Uncharacterized protein n=1 Tax=Rhizophagus irregularis TaxID=588596 RepID=A0A916E1T7_9GLOM|nr:unnamed protein product [Rhizophagus irregularis]
MINYGTTLRLRHYLRHMSKKIPPNKFEHDGLHIHDDFHFCDVKCPFCEYYCILPYGHPQKHDTKYGNMIQTEFTAENDEFEYKGYKLRIGDKGTFVLCSQVCKELGQHRHIDYCQNQGSCELGNQGKNIQYTSFTKEEYHFVNNSNIYLHSFRNLHIIGSLKIKYNHCNDCISNGFYYKFKF